MNLFESFKKNSLWKWLLIGLVIRLILMPIAIHPDLAYMGWSSHFLPYHGVTGIYSYFTENNLCIAYNQACYGYTPIPYFVLGFFQLVFSPIAPDFHYWAEASGKLFLADSKTIDFVNAAGNGIFLNLFFLKLPNLFFDLAIAFLLLKYFDDERKGSFAFKFWMLNPFAIFVSFAFGQFDVIPAFLVMLAIFFAKYNKDFVSIFCIGLAAVSKLYPLMLLPVGVLLLGKNFLQKTKLAIVGLAGFGLFLLPFIFSEGFFKGAFFSGAVQQNLISVHNIFFRIGIVLPDFFKSISLFLIVYSVFAMWLFFSKSEKPLPDFLLATLLLYYAFNIFTFHYFLITTPLFAIFLAENKKFLKLYGLALFFMAFIVLNIGPNLAWNLFTPINHSLAGFPSAPQFFQDLWKPMFRIARIGFSIICLFFVLKIIGFDFKGFVQRFFSKRAS